MANDDLFPETTGELAKLKADAAPEIIDAWRNFSKAVFKEGAIPGKTKQLIAIAVAHVTQCPYCIRAHTAQATRMGATKEEIIEAVWIAAEMRAGAAYAHGTLAMDEIVKHEHKHEHEPSDGAPKRKR